MYDIDTDDDSSVGNWWTWSSMVDLPEKKQPRVYFRNPTGREWRAWRRVDAQYRDRQRAWLEDHEDFRGFPANEDEIAAFVELACSCITKLVNIGKDGEAIDWNDDEQLERLGVTRESIVQSFGEPVLRTAHLIDLGYHIAHGLPEKKRHVSSDSSSDVSDSPTPSPSESDDASASSAKEGSTSSEPDGSTPGS